MCSPFALMGCAQQRGWPFGRRSNADVACGLIPVRGASACGCLAVAGLRRHGHRLFRFGVALARGLRVERTDVFGRLSDIRRARSLYPAWRSRFGPAGRRGAPATAHRQPASLAPRASVQLPNAAFGCDGELASRGRRPSEPASGKAGRARSSAAALVGRRPAGLAEVAQRLAGPVARAGTVLGGLGATGRRRAVSRSTRLRVN